MIGFSIYSYTFSILYIATIAILFVLTHDGWSLFREKLSIIVLVDWWKGQQSGKMKLVRVIDIVIICFLTAILFSYVFGGFGIDIAGYSIFQINNLHKPVIQLLAIIAIRFFIFRGDSLCKGIGDEFVKEGCKSCNDVPDPLDCLGDVYLGAAVLNKNVSFCENIEYDYIKEDCFLQVESIFIGGERHSSRDNF